MERIFFVNYGYDDSWIIGKLANDMISVLTSMGYLCKRGELSDYDGEEIVYHLSHRKSSPILAAKHNSVFYTHTNNIDREFDLEKLKGEYDSYICMSEEDAQFLIELGFDPSKVFGRTLPIRNAHVQPISVGIFSARYNDGVKNEGWLLEYCKENPNAKYVNWVFVGANWGSVVLKLESLGCSFEWINISRYLPYEYRYQQEKLSRLNYYFYMGMDGGAMGTYDAYAMDVPLCVPYDGFHKSIPDIDYSFDNKDTFFKALDEIVNKHMRRLDFFTTHTPSKYAEWILNIWFGKEAAGFDDKYKKCLSYSTIVDKKRENYPLLSRREIRYLMTKMLTAWKVKYFTR